MYTARVYDPGRVWPHGDVLAITETFDACSDRVLEHIENVGYEARHSRAEARWPADTKYFWYKYTVEADGVLVGTFGPDDEGRTVFESGAPDGIGTIVRGPVQIDVNAQADAFAGNRTALVASVDAWNRVREERDDEWADLTGGRWITVAEWREHCVHWPRAVWYVRCVRDAERSIVVAGPQGTKLLVARFVSDKWWSMADRRGAPCDPTHVLIPDARPSLGRSRIELDVLSEVAAAWEAVEPEDVSATGFARWLHSALDRAREKAGVTHDQPRG
jgi:hypothetical protein